MQQIRTNRLFWILQTTGWSVYFIIYTTLFYWGKLQPKGESFDVKNFLLFSLTYVLAFFFTLLLRYIYRYYYAKIENLFLLPMLILLVSFTISALMHFIDLYVSHYFWGEAGHLILKQRLTFKYFFMANYNHLIVFTGWSGLYFGIKYAFDWQKEKLRSRDAEMMAQKAQMAMLRYQLNPHFLFNSLNSIRALVDENQQHAKEMITELSEFLRYSLLHKDATFVTLSNELEAVKHYFFIEKKRFEDKLEIVYNIADNTRNLQIPSFLLHPLIENAVKYGMKTSDMPLKIWVTAQKTGYGLMLEVTNSGKWIERGEQKNHDGGTGTGLMNVEKRLQNAYHDDYRLETNKAEKSISIRIEIKAQYLYG